jgi:hypothetical protein
MEHNHDNQHAFVFGIIGFFLKYFFLDWQLIAPIVEAGLTALVCGFLGMAGKEIFIRLKKRFFKK